MISKLNFPKAKVLSFFLITLLTFSSVVQARPFDWQQDEKQKRQPLPATKYIRSRNIDIKHIALDLRFDWDKEETFGTETMTLAPLVNNLKTVELDAGLMVFNSVKLKDGKALQFKYDEPAEQLSISLDRVYKIGEDMTFIIDYRTKKGTVQSNLTFGAFGGGLKYFKPTADNPNIPKQIWSQGETEYNHYWFPSYDYPNDFRSTELKATVEKPLMVVSNGQLVETKNNSDGTRTFHWKMDTPYANYLTSIVVGEYAEVKGDYAGIPVQTFVYPNEVKEGEVTAKRLPGMVKFFSEKTGVKYPYPKYAQTMAYQFGGGMENISSTTQTDTMIHDARTELDQDQDGLQSHELAHQWFGDYVTCRDWSEIWLNESFATYMASLWTEESKGKDEFLYAEVRGNQQQYYGAWQQGQRRPIVTKNYTDKDAVFDAYAYPRGGAVLHILRKQLGDTNFWRAINHYLTTNAHQPVSTEDLRIAIEETTGQSMDAFFDQWLYKMGHPVFEVTQNYVTGKKQLTLNVKQTQKRDENSSYPQVEFFQTPVDIEIGTASSTRVETVFIEPKAENVFTFNVDSKPLLVDFDNEGTLIKEIKFEKPIDDLIYQMKQDGDVLGQRWAMGELSRLAKDAKTTAADKDKIMAALRSEVENDKFWRLRRAAISEIRTVLVPQMPPNAKLPPLKLDDATIAALLKAAKDTNSNTRADAIAFLSLTKDAKFADAYLAALKDQSYSVIDNAAFALAVTKDARAYDVLTKMLDEKSWKNRVQIAALNGLAALEDKRALEIGFKYANDKTQSRVVRTSALGIVGAVGKGDQRAYPLIFEQFKKALDNNDFQSIFNGLTAIIRLADPRGQEAFDLMKAKFKDNQNFMGFITQLEGQFKEAIK